jgi:trehalose 6-phosphate phosphatase
MRASPKVEDRTNQFFVRLATAKRRALLLDYDGTLAPFTPDRDRAIPYPEATGLLRRIMRETNTRVAMITGRSAENLRALLGLSPVPEIWGTHGLEHLLPDGSYHMVPLDPQQRRGLRAAEQALAGANLERCLEKKPGALALHWRGLSGTESEKVRQTALQAWATIAKGGGLLLTEFDGGMELRLPTHNKGDAVRTILAELGNDSIVAYLGDDLTDEDAFRALRPQDLAVLVRTKPRDTNAHIWIEPPAELLRFLENWLSACLGGS